MIIDGNGGVDRTLVGTLRRRSVIPRVLAFHPMSSDPSRRFT